MAARRAPILEVDSRHPEPRKLARAVEILGSGGIVIVPTDTNYGLCGDLRSREAGEGIQRLRGSQDPHKPLSYICSSLAEASRYAIISDAAFRTLRRLLPGPYTFLLPATREAPRLGGESGGSGRRRTVGIRIPNAPVALALVERLGRPLLSASARGTPGAAGADEAAVEGAGDLAERYGADVALVLDAGVLRGDPSSIVDWTADVARVLRKGAGDVSQWT